MTISRCACRGAPVDADNSHRTRRMSSSLALTRAQRSGSLAAFLTQALIRHKRGPGVEFRRDSYPWFDKAESMAHETLTGVFTPVLTPFDKTLQVDAALFVKFCSWIVTQGAGLAVFGTTSEANSLTVGERLELLACLIDADLPPERMIPGTGACALPDAVTLCAAAAKAKTAAVLMLPP